MSEQEECTIAHFLVESSGSPTFWGIVLPVDTLLSVRLLYKVSEKLYFSLPLIFTILLWPKYDYHFNKCLSRMSKKQEGPHFLLPTLWQWGCMSQTTASPVLCNTKKKKKSETKRGSLSPQSNGEETKHPEHNCLPSTAIQPPRSSNCYQTLS